jgi:hypothetical protein
VKPTANRTRPSPRAIAAYRARERGQGKRHIIEQRAFVNLGPRRLLLGLDPLPGAAGEKPVAQARVLKHVRVPASHLGGDRINHVGKREPPVFLLQRVEILACDRVGDLIPRTQPRTPRNYRGPKAPRRRCRTVLISIIRSML